MARELGRKYPVQSEGYEVPLEDETTEVYAGDIVELHYVADKDLSGDAIRDCVHETLRMKEEYPEFVLHYLKFEQRRIIVQFSLAPPSDGVTQRITAVGAIALALVIRVALILLGVLGGILGLYALKVAIDRQYILPEKPPTGDASVLAKNQETGARLANVTITVSGKTAKTGPSGEAAYFEDLAVGEHVFVGETVDDYEVPDAVTKTIEQNQVCQVTIWYKPTGWVEPTTGWLYVDTTPVRGKVWIGGTEYENKSGLALELDVGEYKVFFEAIEGYNTPAMQTANIVGGQSESILAYYMKPGENWWEKYIKYGLIGGAAIVGAAVLVPEIIRAIARRRE